MMLENLAREALLRGDLAGAAVAARALALERPDDPAGFFLLGMAAAEAGHPGKAVSLLESAVQRMPRAEYLAQLAKLLTLLRRDGEASIAARDALLQRPDDALTFDTIGCVLARLGDHEASIVPFKAAVVMEPDNLEYRYNLASASGFTGRVEEAGAHYETILKADPGNARAHYALAILSRQTGQFNHVSRLEGALSNASDPADVLRIRYALAKELADLGNPAASFKHLSAANEAQKRAVVYGFSQDAAIFDAVAELFENGAALAPGTGDSSSAPIFVVGMPRTGTTLIDRILSSHRDVESAGELQAMPLAVKQLSGTSSRRVIDAETVAESAHLDPAALGHAYLQRACHHRLHGTARFVDKLPANFLYVGYIARAFPNARVVCLRRHPMDTVWSNYKNLFASQSAYYAYSYDLMDTARYYERFDKLIALWDRIFPGLVLQLSYEALVNDQAGQTKRLLEYCKLEWDDACLSFHQNLAPVATPSAAQVRRPINSDGVGQWRAYAEALEPARAWLQARGVNVD